MDDILVGNNQAINPSSKILKPQSSLPSASSIIKISQVNQSFLVGDETVDVLHGVTFNIETNSFNIIFGPSGSGKSTLLNILTGLQKPTDGSVLFDGEALYDLSPNELAWFRANKIGIVYQQNFWVRSLNVIENVAMPLFFMGQSRSSALAKAQKTLELVQMGAYSKKNPSLLSGGEQQRIAMARALVNNPLFIIADEPTGNLDSKNGDMIMNLLRSIQKDLNRIVILVTHNMEYLPLAHKLLKISDGQVEEMENHSIQETTNTLIKEMKDRIDSLSHVNNQRGNNRG